MGAWSEGSARASGMDLHYIRTGDGETPPLLLLHGLTDNGRYWSRTARALEERFDVIMVDQRGHGQSSKPDDGYSAEEMAEDAADLIRLLGVAPASVLGHSMGGSVAIALAAAHPDLVRRILLLDPPLRLTSADHKMQEQIRRRMEGWRREIFAEQQLSAADIERGCLERNPHWHAEDCHYLAEAHLQVHPPAITGFQVRQAWQDTFPRIACPVLLIYGDGELGSIVDHELAREVARSAANVELAHIPGAGHSAQRERFEAYIASVKAFLAVSSVHLS